MAEAVKNDCAKGELIVNVKTRRRRFKAGAELSKSVIRADVDWNENQSEAFSELEVKLHLTNEECATQQVFEK